MEGHPTGSQPLSVFHLSHPDSRCSVLLLDGPAGTLHHGAAPTLPVAYSAAIDGMSIGADAGSCGAAAYLDAAVIAEDIALDPRWDGFRDLALPHGLRSCWSRPIRGGTGILGTFAVYHDVPHRPGGREQRLVERFTHLASVAIEHSRLFGALAESEERFRRAFEDNAVGMALTDLDGRFGKVNRALQQMLGRSERDLLAVDLAALLPTDVREAGIAALCGLVAGPSDSGQFETALLRLDGERVRAAITASVVRGADGTPVYLSVNVLDVTARRAAERDRRARREAELARGVAEQASRAKSQFLSALSHELRTRCRRSPASPRCWAPWTCHRNVATRRAATSPGRRRPSCRWSTTCWTSPRSRPGRCRSRPAMSTSGYWSARCWTCWNRWLPSAGSGCAGGPSPGGCARTGAGCGRC